MKADRQATEAAGFSDPKSYVAKDGREVLKGEDWERRKRILWERADGRCEEFMAAGLGSEHLTPLRCGCDGTEPHHIIRRSEKRDDRLLNLQLLCHFHHSLKDKRVVRSDKREWREVPRHG